MNQFDFERPLKRILTKKNMTVKTLCEEIGTSQQNMNRIFRANKISTDKLIEIADHLGVDIHVFFSGNTTTESAVYELKKEIAELTNDLYAYKNLSQSLQQKSQVLFRALRDIIGTRVDNSKFSTLWSQIGAKAMHPEGFNATDIKHLQELSTWILNDSKE